jgi:hypothetical protein
MNAPGPEHWMNLQPSYLTVSDGSRLCLRLPQRLGTEGMIDPCDPYGVNPYRANLRAENGSGCSCLIISLTVSGTCLVAAVLLVTHAFRR